jgi:putative membrane protein
MSPLPLAFIGWVGFPFFWGGLGFTILLVVLIVLLARGLPSGGRASGGDAVRLLEERYARGEIDREEFLVRRAVLTGSSSEGPGAGIA